MTNQLDKAKKSEETLSSHLEQRLKSLNNLEVEIGQYKEEVSSLRSQLEEARKQAQGAEKVMETLAFIEGQVDEAEKERNTMICKLEENDEEIFKMKTFVWANSSYSSGLSLQRKIFGQLERICGRREQ